VVDPFLASICEAAHMAGINYEYDDWFSSDRVPEWLMPHHADAQMAIHEPIVDEPHQTPAAECLSGNRFRFGDGG
jgi:hypothetical protein